MESPGLKFAASLVVAYHIDPAEALRTAKERGFEVPVELPTFQRYLREHGLNRKNRRMNRTNFRRFEAANPGDVFQFDISGSKERWYDTKTRRIVNVSALEVSKNHENENKNRTRVWRFVLLDDFSRRKFIRFVACDKPNSSHVVAFLLEAYEEMGVPKILYTDNDQIIKYGRNRRAAQILDKSLADVGGYKLQQHLPGNSRATGKVENAHQSVEKFEKLLGLLIAEGRIIDLGVLDRFAKQLTIEANYKKHRETNEKPIDRWNSKRHTVRTVDAKILKSAFLCDEFEVRILDDLAFKYKGAAYQLPSDQGLENLVARQGKGNKVKIIFPDDMDFFTLIDFDGNEYDIVKVLATPDTFGEFKSLPEDVAEKTRKELKNFAKENARAVKELNQAGYTPKPIPIIDTVYEVEKTNMLSFPKPTVDVTPQILETLPTPHKVAASGYAGELISWYDAVRIFNARFSSKSECKQFLDTLFASREETQPEALIRNAVDSVFEETPKLRVAK